MGREDESLLKTALKWTVAVIVAIAALRLLFWAMQVAWSVGMFLLVTVVPIVLVGALTVWLIGYFRRDRHDAA